MRSLQNFSCAWGWLPPVCVNLQPLHPSVVPNLATCLRLTCFKSTIRPVSGSFRALLPVAMWLATLPPRLSAVLGTSTANSLAVGARTPSPAAATLALTSPASAGLLRIAMTRSRQGSECVWRRLPALW